MVIFKVKLNLKVKIYPIFGLWVCPGDKSIPNKVRLSKFGPKMHLSTVKVPIDFGIGWSWSSVSFLTSNLLHSTKFLRLLNICVVLYIFSEVYLYILVRPLEFSQPRLGNWHWILQAAIGFRHVIYASLVEILYANTDQSPKQQ